MKSTQTNGCGACDGWFKFIKPPHYRFFNDICNLHDEAYNTGGSKEDRRLADRLLFNGMVLHSVTVFKGRSVHNQMWFIFLAYCYYIAVRIFGSPRFNYC